MLCINSANLFLDSNLWKKNIKMSNSVNLSLISVYLSVSIFLNITEWNFYVSIKKHHMTHVYIYDQIFNPFTNLK